MIRVRFPKHPSSVPNGSHDMPENVDDIVMQGYRRSLADWLVICGKTLGEVNNLLDQGYGIRQALVFGLPYLPVRKSDRAALIFASVPQYSPETLSDFEVRLNRLVAHLAKYSEMPSHLRVPWARRLLTECYACWRKKKLWHPCVEDWYPHVKVLPIGTKENEDVMAWKYLSSYLSGDWVSGFYATPRLENFFEPKLSRYSDLAMWYDKVSILPIANDEIVSVEEMCAAIGAHKNTLYRSWNRVGVSIQMERNSGPLTFERWKELARRVDERVRSLKEKRKATRRLTMKGRV